MRVGAPHTQLAEEGLSFGQLRTIEMPRTRFKSYFILPSAGFKDLCCSLCLAFVKFSKFEKKTRHSKSSGERAYASLQMCWDLYFLAASSSVIADRFVHNHLVSAICITALHQSTCSASLRI